MKVRAISAIVGLTGVTYLLTCLMTVSDSNAIRAIEYVVRASIFAACVSMMYQRRAISLFTYVAAFLFFFALGVVYGNRASFVAADIMSFLVIIFVFLLNQINRDEITAKLVSLMSGLLVIGFGFSLFFFVSNGLQPAESVDGRLDMDNVSEAGYFKYAMSLVQLSILLLPFSWHVGYVKRLVIYSVALFFFVVSAFTLSRVGIASFLVSCALTFFIGISGGLIRPRFSLFFTVAIILGLLISVVVNYWDMVSILFSLSATRFGELSGEAIEPRDIEAAVYFANSTISELAVGKGFGGVNNYPFGRYIENGLMMLHRGENNLILKGGFLYLIFLYGAAVVGLIRLLFSKCLYSKQWAVVLVLFLFMERGHQQYSQFFMLLFFCVGISYGWNSKLATRSTVTMRRVALK